MRPLTITGHHKAQAELFANLPPADCSIERFGKWLASQSTFLAFGAAVSFAIPLCAAAFGLVP